MFAAEGAAEAHRQPEQIHELPLQQGGVRLARAQQVHMQVAVTQVAVGHDGAAEAVHALEEFPEAAARHDDVLTHLLGMTLLQEDAGHAAHGPDALALAHIRGDLKGVRHGTQQIKKTLEEGV